MGTERSLATRLVFTAALVVLLALVPIALAAKGGTPNGGGKGGGSAGTPTVGGTSLSLISNTVKLNPNWPSSCLSEDDYDQRVFSGSLNGSFSTSYQTCGLNTSPIPTLNST